MVALAVPSTIRPALAVGLPEATYPLVTEEEVLGAAAARLLLDSPRQEHTWTTATTRRQKLHTCS